MWRPDTPAWNTKTRPFNEKLGFTVWQEKDAPLDFERPVA